MNADIVLLQHIDTTEVVLVKKVKVLANPKYFNIYDISKILCFDFRHLGSM